MNARNEQTALKRLLALSGWLIPSAMLGALLTILARHREWPLVEVLASLGTDWWWPGGVAGALIGHLIWTMMSPRQRLPRAAIALATLNASAWFLYIALTPPVAEADLRTYMQWRTDQDATGVLNMIFDGPSVLAGRPGGFWSANRFHSVLKLCSGPAIEYAELLVVPSRYVGLPPTRRESYVVAVIAFVCSTAFWIAVGRLLSGTTAMLRRGRRLTVAAPVGGPGNRS